jgi:hypothetical protein
MTSEGWNFEQWFCYGGLTILIMTYSLISIYDLMR